MNGNKSGDEGGGGGKKGKTRIGKAFTLCKKWRAEKIKGEISRRSARSRLQNEARREKSGLRRVKNEGDPSKNRPKTDLKRGKARKTEILERKRRGGVEAKKWALLPILQYYEVAKWAQMKFSRIFFGDLLQGMQKCSTFALAIGKQRSCKRELRSESAEAAKALL